VSDLKLSFHIFWLEVLRHYRLCQKPECSITTPYSLFAIAAMSLKPYRRKSQDPISMNCNCSHCCAVTVPQTLQQLVAFAPKQDWTLFPDVCQKPTFITISDVAPTQPKFCEDVKHALYQRQHSEPKEVGEVSRKGSDTLVEMPYLELWPATDCSSPNPADVHRTPPSRPTPQRLPTPDLAEIEESDFWSCCEPYEGNIRDFYGRVSKVHRL